MAFNGVLPINASEMDTATREFKMKMSIILLTINGVAWAACLLFLNEQFSSAAARQEKILAQLDGLRVYLYEIDPQFEDERSSFGDAGCNGDLNNSRHYYEILSLKRGLGKRTLGTPFSV